MKPRYYILFLLSTIALNVFSQTVQYPYDAAGNRLGRTIVMLRSAAIISQEKLAEEMETREIYSDKMNQSDIRIYPNPTKGVLKVEIIRMDEENPIHIQLYDMSGRILINKPNAAPFTDLNISDKPAGAYLLKIFSENKATHWKIIKE